MDRSVLLAVLVLIVSATVGAVVPATAVSDTPGGGDVTGASQGAESLSDDGAAPLASTPNTTSVVAQQQEFDRTQYVITVREDGSARWTFRFERPLANETEQSEFRAFAEEFNSTETDLYTNFQRDARGLVSEGANFTGREMEATNFDRDARIESGLNTVGVVEMSFTWDAFAEIDGDRVVVADVFEDGLFIYRDQSLVIRTGDGLAFDTVAPNGTLSNPDSLARSDSVTWQGEKQFTDNRPQVVFVPASTISPTVTSAATPGSGDSPTPGSGDGSEDSGLPSGLLVGAFVVVALLGAGAWYWRSGGELPAGGSSPGGAGNRNTTDTAGRFESSSGSDEPVGETSNADAGDSSAAGAGAGAGAAAASTDDAMPEPSVSDEELLSDDDRVVRLLEEHGGRMKQVNIVDETGWSKSKVSMLLSDMEDDETISKLRVGRENVISLAGHEPEAANSPFDDEE